MCFLFSDSLQIAESSADPAVLGVGFSKNIPPDRLKCQIQGRFELRVIRSERGASSPNDPKDLFLKNPLYNFTYNTKINFKDL